jgi:hypothetical protein
MPTVLQTHHVPCQTLLLTSSSIAAARSLVGSLNNSLLSVSRHSLKRPEK